MNYMQLNCRPTFHCICRNRDYKFMHHFVFQNEVPLGLWNQCVLWSGVSSHSRCKEKSNTLAKKAANMLYYKMYHN